MNTLAEIEAAVSKLSVEDLTEFRGWFEDFDAEAWDRQFEKDALSGALDAAVGDRVRLAVQEGQFTDL